MERKTKHTAATLNDKDRKVLEMYAKFYTNFIESNTVKTDIHEYERYDPDAR